MAGLRQIIPYSMPPHADDFNVRICGGDRIAAFFMTYCGHRIRYGVTGQTLEALEPKPGRTAKGRLDAFDLPRAIIEPIASAKFDRQQLRALSQQVA